MGCNLLLPGAVENRMLLLWPREGVLCRLHLLPLVLEWIQLSVVLLLLPWYVLGRAWNLDLAVNLSLSIPLAMHLDVALILTLALLLQVMKMMLTVLLRMLLPGRRPALLP